MESAVASPRSAARQVARDARARHDWPELLAQATRIQLETPDEPDGYILAAIALRRLQQRPALRALLADALQRFPGHPQLLALRSGNTVPKPIQPASSAELEALPAAIRTAVEQADWAAAAQLCAKLLAAAPDSADAYQTGSRAWREQRRLGRADDLSRRGLERFPDHVGILLERTTVLLKHNRLEDALACCDRVRQLQPDVPTNHARSANTLALLGRFDHAEALLAAALDRFGLHIDLLVQHAITATKRLDFPVARARWEAVRAVAPNDVRLESFAGALSLAEQLHAIPEDGEGTPDAETEPGAVELTDAAVLKRFEGLGGNCEFGLVQRLAGIEPLGLLRFASITSPELAALLGGGLESVGEEAYTTLSLNGRQEYMLTDRRFFRSHTLVNYGNADEAELLTKLRRRTLFLRDKLLVELRQGTKIFLYRPADGVIEDTAISELIRAFRQRSTAPFVCVRNAAAGEAPMTVTDRGDGLLVATMPAHSSKLGLSFVQAQLYPSWIALCRTALTTLTAAVK